MLSNACQAPVPNIDISTSPAKGLRKALLYIGMFVRPTILTSVRLFVRPSIHPSVKCYSFFLFLPTSSKAKYPESFMESC